MENLLGVFSMTFSLRSDVFYLRGKRLPEIKGVMETYGWGYKYDKLENKLDIFRQGVFDCKQ